MSDINRRKTVLLNELDEVEREALLILDRIKTAKTALCLVQTASDLEKWQDEQDLEEGLLRIILS